MTPLTKEFDFYRSNQKELLSQYADKFLVIRGEHVVGAYETRREAYEESMRRYALGTFLIQQCIPGVDLAVQSFHSRAIFT